MSRNGSGSYSLPSGNPVVQGTTISSTWANALTADIAAELTDSLSRSGNGGMLAPLKAADGTVAAPGVTFGADTDTGLYRAGANDARMAVGGADVGRWSSDGYAVTGNVSASGGYKAPDGAVGAPAYAFTSEPTSGLYRAGAGDLRLAVLGAEVLKLLASGGKVTGALEVTGAVTSGQLAATGIAGQAGGAFANGTAATGATRQTAAALTNGDLSLVGVANPDPSAALTNVLSPAAITKAWAFVQTDGMGNASLLAGMNIAAVAVGGTQAYVELTLAAGLTDASHYAISVTPYADGSGQPVAHYGGCVAPLAPFNAVRVFGLAFTVASPSAASAINFATSVRAFFVVLYGLQ